MSAAGKKIRRTVVVEDAEVQQRDGYDANQLKIEVFTPEQKVVTVSEFFHRSVKKMIGGIRECDPVPTNEFNTPATLIKKINMSDSSVTRQLDLQSPPPTFKSSGSSSGSGSKKNRLVDLESLSTTGEASGSAESSGSKKRRVVVDLDDIESEPEDEAREYDPDLVQVKIEPED
ncbi:hypothetical protein CTI12_AA558380 [Artemisia annua]|uniref:Uncharacterized protein n=1 Tax=Artemisia annua TaxID=35608 RepID=A0A2U1KR74_ARTAN|nr:hypothetical protein CTI12_AA558380 [Artemisia annua]